MSEAPDRESKTEEPTQKRLTDAIGKGKVPFSRELPVLMTGCAIWLTLSFMLIGVAGQLAAGLRPFVENPGGWSLHTASDTSLLIGLVSINAVAAVSPIIAIIVLAGLSSGLAQSRGLALDRISPDLSRISPMQGWTRLFGAAGGKEAAKSVLKLTVVAVLALWALHGFWETRMILRDADAGTFAGALVSMTARLVGTILVGFLFVAILDVSIVRVSWLRDLMMTKQEVKDEAKEGDVDPLVKFRMRLLARQRLRKRMIAAVPRATVIIANPTHYSVALRYSREEGGAPRVVAKGRDRIALRIRSIAQQHGIPIVEDRWLARTLHDQVPVDAFIPPEFYKVVAKIIFYLTKQSNASTGRQ
jgi:flagellar biosynthesis protein FlhB